MDPKIVARAAAIILLGVAVLAGALELARQGRTLNSSLPAAHDNLDLTDELARCRALGAEAAHDGACKGVWAQNRARFLAPSAPHQDHSIELFPTTPDVPKGYPRSTSTERHQPPSPTAARQAQVPRGAE